MGEWSERVMRVVRERIETEADSIGVAMVAGIRESISIPVEYLDGGFVVRSDPFDYPRKEFGQLWESQNHVVRNEGAVIALDVFNNCPYARRLHDGHSNVDPRPFHDKAMDEVWRAEIPVRIYDAIVGVR